MFCALTYLFGHSIYFARLHHVNPLCKHKCAFLQMKETLNQKVQEKKPLLKFKNTKKYMCLERIWRTSFRHRPLMARPSTTIAVTGSLYMLHPTLASRLDHHTKALSQHPFCYRFPSVLIKQHQLFHDNFRLCDDGSGKGAGLVAAIATRLHAPETS